MRVQSSLLTALLCCNTTLSKVKNPETDKEKREHPLPAIFSLYPGTCFEAHVTPSSPASRSSDQAEKDPATRSCGDDARDLWR